MIKKLDGNVYVCGLGANGRLGLGNEANVNKLTKVTLPSAVTSKVKYIKARKYNKYNHA